MNKYHDETFLSLLSSQRQLLIQLKTEKEDGGKSAPADDKLSKSTSSSRSLNWFPRRTSIQTANQFSSSHDKITPKRLSLSMTADDGLVPSLNTDSTLGSNVLDTCGHSTLSLKKINQIPIDVPVWKKRRLSMTMYGFLSEEAFEKTDMRETGSIVSWGNEGYDSQDQETDSEDDYSWSCECVEPPRLGSVATDPLELKRAMQDFTSAMEKSQKSQQDIHDWDRKMGLKRSHSKTMRLSSRSRKQLRAILKRDINVLVPIA